jgi:ribosome-associated heat shock protein Hsp15
MADEKLRLDKYLWAIRIFKTRTQATEACDAGKVKWKSTSVKPSRQVALGDRYDIKTPARKWTIEVTALLHNRVQFLDAIKYYADITSEEDKKTNDRMAASYYTGKRMSKTGRPSKKQRRERDEFFEEE